MSGGGWFDTKHLASYAKTAISEAQKTLDKALDIKEGEEGAAPNLKEPDPVSSPGSEKAPSEVDASETSSTTSSKSSRAAANAANAAANAAALWGSFTGSYFQASNVQGTQEGEEEQA